MKRSNVYSLLIITSLCTAPGISFAQEGVHNPEVVKQIRDQARNKSQAKETLEDLCNNVGPRLTGSENIKEAYAWALKQFKDLGLDAKLEKWGSWPVTFKRGPASGKIIVPALGEKALTFSTDAWTAGTDGAVRGKAILEPESIEDLEEALNSNPDAFKSAWIVSRQLPTRIFRRPRRGRDVARRLWKLGIAGWVQPARGELLITGGRPFNVTPDNLPNKVLPKITESQWKELTTVMKKHGEVWIEFNIQNEFVLKPSTHYNVIADLKGTEKPDEMVIVGGHLDSWDGATGAQDNGTGVSTTIEAARILTSVNARPKRTIRFILWSGEEQGLLGSRAYVKTHAKDLKQISAVLVHDGGTNTCSGIEATASQFDAMQLAFAPLLNDGHKYPFEIRKVKSLYSMAMGGSSDHGSYLARNVPGYFWIQKGDVKYKTSHHTQHDHPVNVRDDYQRRSAEVISLGALGIANLPNLLSRKNLTDTMARRQTLGVQLDGMKITSIVPNSVAARGGFKVGDVFLRSGKRQLVSLQWLRAVIRNADGDTEFTVLRDKKEVTLIAPFRKRGQKPKMLGIMLDGMTITNVTPESVADKAGMRPGDTIISGANKEIKTLGDLRNVIQNANGRTVFVLKRDGEKISVIADFGGEKKKKKRSKLY